MLYKYISYTGVGLGGAHSWSLASYMSNSASFCMRSLWWDDVKDKEYSNNYEKRDDNNEDCQKR